jgi:hypothetical protein
MSFIDPARARRELAFAPEPVESYLGKVVASFLAHPDGAPPENYRLRPLELELARAERV